MQGAPGAPATTGEGAAMLSDEDFELLARWRIRAFGQKLREICMDEGMDSLTFEEKVGLCIEAERTAREDRKIQKAVRAARFKLPGACIEDIAYLPDRTLGRDRIARLASCAWIAANENLVILSESGGGKSYVAQALGNAACRKLLTVRYVRLNDMCRELERTSIAHIFTGHCTGDHAFRFLRQHFIRRRQAYYQER